MRLVWLILVGNAVLGCKDPPPVPAATATEASPALPGRGLAATPAAPSAPSGPAAVRAQPRPSLELEREFASETEDKAWADATEASIRAVAPELSDVTCHRESCQVTVTASSVEDLVTKTDKLQADDSLRGTGAKNILLTAPLEADGKRSMKIYVRYER